MIIIACNTASAVAYEHIKQECPNIKVVNVIDPIVEYLSKQKTSKKVGVIGTKGTINSNIYPKKINALMPNTEVCTLATPLLAPMIEEGFINDTISQTVVNNYLKDKKLKEIDKIILACTHYPLIETIVRKYYNNRIEIIDSASQVAKYIKTFLSKTDQLSQTKADYHFFVSDYTLSFEQSAKFFFNQNIKLEEIRLNH